MPVNWSDYEPYIQTLKIFNVREAVSNVPIGTASTTARNASAVNTILASFRTIGLLEQ